jgi:SAM-dependent methyltransferase
MQLSELLLLKNLLANHSADPIRRVARQDLDKIQHLISNQNVDMTQHQQTLAHKLNDIDTAFVNYELQLNLLKQELTDLIKTAEKPWFQESYKFYEQEINHNSCDYILSKSLHVDVETKKILSARLMNYTNWQVPAMIIRPAHEDFIQHVVSYDPLYLVDLQHELLKPAMDKFNTVYQRRLRPYKINDQDTELFYKMPKEQFGMCFAYGFFNYRPIEVIKLYLTEILTLLRPGGVCIITFNDCDRHSAVELVEKKYACYTPGYLVYELVKSLGYEILYTHHNHEASTWLELRKPGQMTSIRGGQTLAKIIPKPVAESK